MNGPKFELDETVVVSVGGSEITGVVDMFGFQRDHEGAQYLVEWLNGKGAVNSRWFNESKVAKVRVNVA